MLMSCEQNAQYLPGRDRHLVAAVCATTRNREAMFAALLRSLRGMDIPSDVTVIFVFVENDAEPLVKGAVDAFRAAVPELEVRYALEPDLGIPVARNRAVKAAIDAGADVILFVDDDETVAADWLKKMIACYRSTNLMLIGGPVRAIFEGAAKNSWQAGLRRGLEDRCQSKIDRANSLHARGEQHRITIITSNWLADAALFTRYGLRFDQDLRFTGGSDTQFHRDARAAGAKTGWCPDAFVYELQPPERVSARYQYWRAAEQARASLHAKIRSKGRAYALAQFIPLCIVRSCGVLFTALLLPIMGGRIAVRVARGAGWIAGRVSGFFGARSSLYSKTTGY